MDGISIASGIISIATAGIQISIKLITLSTQVSSASERVSSVANDISLTSGVLHQLGDLMNQKSANDGISVFNEGGLQTTRTSAETCERIFTEIEKECGKASEQIRGCRKISDGKVKLSKSEKLKWPFLQPSLEILRADLREAKGTLMLMLQITTLALAKKMADLNATATNEQRDLYRAIIALRKEQKGQDIDKPIRNIKQSSVESTTSDAATLKNKSESQIFPGAPGLCAHELRQVEGPYPDYPPLPDSYKQLDEIAKEHEKSGGNGSPEKDLVPTEFAQLGRHEMPVKNDTMPSVDLINPQSSISPSPSHASIPFSTSQSYLTSNHRPLDDLSSYDFQPQSRFEQKNPAIFGRSKSLKTIDPELQMFMLKPVVKDFFDRIELSWSVLQPKMGATAVKDHLAQIQAKGLPSVMDMLETLHEHEHSILDVYQGKGELRSLKRTRTDIQHRDILFKDVPGLQFVVEPQNAYPSGLTYYAFDDSEDAVECEDLPTETNNGLLQISTPQLPPESQRSQLDETSTFPTPSTSPPDIPDIFKSLRTPIDATTAELFPTALRKQGIEHDFDNYALYIQYEDQERCLQEHEKPLIIYQQLVREERGPVFVARRKMKPEDISPGPTSKSPESRSFFGTSGNASEDEAKTSDPAERRPVKEEISPKNNHKKTTVPVDDLDKILRTLSLDPMEPALCHRREETDGDPSIPYPFPEPGSIFYCSHGPLPLDWDSALRGQALRYPVDAAPSPSRDGRMHSAAQEVESNSAVPYTETDQEYSSDDVDSGDSNDPDRARLPPAKRPKTAGGFIAADKKLVEDLLQQYTTWKPPKLPGAVDIPGGLL